MNEFTESSADEKEAWESPTLQEIPIAFEASAYALTDDDLVIR
jgi:hypothetical protein